MAQHGFGRAPRAARCCSACVSWPRPPTLSAATRRTSCWCVTATDPNDDPLTFGVYGLPRDCSFSEVGDCTGNIICNPLYDAEGAYEIRVEASDSENVIAETFTLTITNVNQSPTVDPVPPQEMYSEDPIHIAVTGSDPDGDAVTIVMKSGPTWCYAAGMSIQCAGPDNADDVVSISVAARDVFGAESTPTSFDLSVYRVEPPDLEVADFSAPSEIWAGQQVSLGWTIANRGPAPATGSWRDCVFLSQDDTYQAGDTLLGCSTRPQDLSPAGEAGDQYTRIRDFGVPSLPAGDYWIVLVTDVDGVVSEEVFSNNQGSAGPIPMRVQPCANLKPSAVTIITETVQPGKKAAASWLVGNDDEEGEGPTSVPLWYDRVYLSASGTLNDLIATAEQVPNPVALGLGEVYPQSLHFTVPLMHDGSFVEGDYFVVVRTDSAQQVKECSESDNYAISAGTLRVTEQQPRAVLTVGDASVRPTTATTGAEVAISWSLRNTGPVPTGPFAIDHAIALSDSDPGTGKPSSSKVLAWNLEPVSENLDPFDSELPDEERIANLGVVITLPPDVWGDKYITIWPDPSGQADVDVETASIPISILPPSPADLVVSDLTGPVLEEGETVLSGHEIEVDWTVRNDGALTRANAWTDEIVLEARPIGGVQEWQQLDVLAVEDPARLIGARGLVREGASGELVVIASGSIRVVHLDLRRVVAG